MKLSVVIVSWNAQAFLLKCLESILGQCVAPLCEIIVVDNRSSDGSPETVRLAFPSVKVIDNPANYGFAKANNIGIQAAHGDYLFLINSDVVVAQDCFSRMVQYMEQHPEVGLLGPRIKGADGNTQRSCMGYPTLWNTLTRALALDVLFPQSKLVGSQLLTFWQHDDTRAVEVINGCFWLVRRSALGDVGLLDERFFIYGEDVDWCKRFNNRGWRVVFTTDAEAIHFGGASSANAPVRFYVEMQRATYQYWRKHHSLAASATFLMINVVHHVVRMLVELLLFPLGRHEQSLAAHNVARAWASTRWAVATTIGSLLGSERSGRDVASQRQSIDRP